MKKLLIIAMLFASCKSSKYVTDYHCKVVDKSNNFYSFSVTLQDLKDGNVYFTKEIAYSDIQIGDTIVLPWVELKLTKRH